MRTSSSTLLRDQWQSVGWMLVRRIVRFDDPASCSKALALAIDKIEGPFVMGGAAHDVGALYLLLSLVRLKHFITDSLEPFDLCASFPEFLNIPVLADF